MALLDCRDARISLWQPDRVLESPGFVLLEGGEYRFGNDAKEQLRVRPRDSNHRFWWQLSTQPLKPALGAARHTADLVHSHLRHIHQSAGAPSEIALAVPDSMPKEQLSLLLGVAQACDFKVTGLVSRSVLLASTSAALQSRDRLWHLEAQLNQTVLNELVLQGDRIELARSTPLPACGLLALQERCVGAIASAFVQQTRYDPRRSANSEQTLYNNLPAILAEVAERGEASVDIEGHRCRITASALASASERLLAGLAQARGALDLPLLLDPELQAFPGVATLPGNVIPLCDDAIWTAWGAQHAIVELNEDEVHLVHRLPPNLPSGGGAPTKESPASAPAAELERKADTAPTEDQATHVLLGTRAWALRGGEVPLGGGFSLREHRGQWALQGDGALVNGLPSSPAQPLQLGDTLSLGTAGHGRLIEVLD